MKNITNKTNVYTKNFGIWRIISQERINRNARDVNCVTDDNYLHTAYGEPVHSGSCRIRHE